MGIIRLDIAVLWGFIICGMSPTDWCPSPPWDGCGKHADTASCRSDKDCAGLPYRGESVEACIYDSEGYAKNCPTVGCVTRCEKLSDTHCQQIIGRCKLEAPGKCAPI